MTSMNINLYLNFFFGLLAIGVGMYFFKCDLYKKVILNSDFVKVFRTPNKHSICLFVIIISSINIIFMYLVYLNNQNNFWEQLLSVFSILWLQYYFL